MPKGIVLKVWGDFALFSRPEFTERVSYDVITPTAARGIVEAIYWSPSIRWSIDYVHVLKPIRFQSLTRNEVGTTISYANARYAARQNESLPYSAIDDRQQRSALILRNVAYIIQAHFRITSAAEEKSAAKHASIIRRRLERGQCVHQPCLGCREFMAFFAPAELSNVTVPEELGGTRDLGWMLHDIDHDNGSVPRFFKAALEDGLMTIPPRP